MSSRILSRRLSIGVLLAVFSTSTVLAEEYSFAGSFSGRAIGVVQGGTFQAAGSGSGTASHIGLFNYLLEGTVDLVSGNSTGVFLLIFSNGDVLYGPFFRARRPAVYP